MPPNILNASKDTLNTSSNIKFPKNKNNSNMKKDMAVALKSTLIKSFPDNCFLIGERYKNSPIGFIITSIGSISFIISSYSSSSLFKAFPLKQGKSIKIEDTYPSS
jgi:hypothetical protein